MPHGDLPWALAPLPLAADAGLALGVADRGGGSIDGGRDGNIVETKALKLGFSGHVP